MGEDYRLLVVDDEAEIRNGMGKYFPWDRVGFTLAGTAEDGRKAFEFVVKNPVDVVLCDIRMPVTDGLEFTRQLRDAGLDTLVILFSAHRDFEYARQALNLGVRHYLVKSAPFDEVLGLFQQVRDELDRTRSPGGPPAENHHARIVAAVTAYVRQHLADNPNLENMARHVGLNADYLGKVFRSVSGRHFSDFLMAERMEKAAEHLADIGLKVYEVGALVGYYNPKNFARAFKAYHGISPRRFRNPDAEDGDDE